MAHISFVGNAGAANGTSERIEDLLQREERMALEAELRMQAETSSDMRVAYRWAAADHRRKADELRRMMGRVSP